MSRSRQLRSDRVLHFRLASLAPLVGSVAEKLKDSKVVEWSTRVDGPLDVDLRLVWSALNACFNIESLASPANGGRIRVPAACAVGLKSNSCRVRACCAMPCGPFIA